MPIPMRDFSILSQKWLTGFSPIFSNNLHNGKLCYEFKRHVIHMPKYHSSVVKSYVFTLKNAERKSWVQFSYLDNKEFLKPANFLERCNPSVTQTCLYHSLSNDWSHIDRKIGRECHFTNIYRSPVNYVTKRQFSMAWLESLAITQTKWFQALGQSWFVEGLMRGLQNFHDYTHLPWWAAIVVSTVLIRGILTFPVAVYQNHILAKLENLKPEMDELLKDLGKETAHAAKRFGWDQRHARHMFNRSAKKLWNELIIRENCHPFKTSMLLWVQIPFWISVTMSLRNMASMMPHQDIAAQVLFMEFSTGGFGWIPNLTDVDHSLILPFAMGITNIIITEINVLNRQKKGTKVQNIVTNVFRGISVAIIPIAACVPSCVTLYWVTSSMCALVQNLALMHPQVRHLCGIPQSPSERERPYHHLWMQLQKRVKKKKD
ncbi:cytochrome c oxidase assembly protein COX18, mitochondrial [Panulirus ornatus]|uniref:cytochrome c oxidase assembly protein COX18, mitochondrial n=1 Tax=Panulirus ornatus TaxID=150431 RepID=UPI003A84E5E0